MAAAAATPVLRSSAFRASSTLRSAAYQQLRYASSKSLKDAFGAQVPKLIEQNKKLKKQVFLSFVTSLNMIIILHMSFEASPIDGIEIAGACPSSIPI